jgi:endo-1,4-beta-D-glucanase Y
MKDKTKMGGLDEGFKKVVLWMSLLGMLSFPVLTKAQINTPAPTIPFNSNAAYPTSTVLPTNALASDATSAYNTWKSQYVAACGANFRVKFDDPTQTVSEGIGYGMLIAAYAGDKALFDGLWGYYKANSNGNGLMNWKIGGCSGASGSNGATDADEDAAMGLVIAAYQWPAATSPYTYSTEATTLIKAINKCEIDKNTSPNFQVSNGDGWINCNSSGNNCRNPGYMAPAYYKCWSTTSYLSSTTVTAPWSTVESVAMTLVNANANATTGLASDWSDQNGTVNTCNGGVSGWGYDASREPWRMATYAAWYGNANAITISNRIAAATLSAGATNVGGPVAPAGGSLSGHTHNATFVSMLAAGTFGSTTGTQANSNAMYTELIGTVDAGAGTANPSGYFGNTLRVISIFFATKNFWNPCNVNTTPPVTCKQPNLGATTISTCGTGFPVLLNSNTNTDAAHNVKFTWKRVTPSATTLVSASTTANTYSVTSANGAGTYAVIRDSNGVCSNSDTVIITSTLPTPSLGGNPAALCSTTFYDLTPSNTASFPGGTTWQWDVDYSGGTTYSTLTGETNSTLLNVRKAGRYRVTASISGCSSTSDDVVITSNMPTPVDACINAAGSITLSIANPGLNGTNYNWYTTAGGSTLATVTSGSASNTTSITTNVVATTTFYVQDMSAVSGFVGATSVLGGTTNWSLSASNRMLFTATANFTINSVQIPFDVYSTSAGTVTVEILDNSNTVRATATSTNTTPGSTGSDQLLTFTFSPGLYVDQATWGSNLKFVLLSETMNGDAKWNDNTLSTTYCYPASCVSPVVSINGSEGFSGGNNDYGYFYHWNISSGSACARLPVVAKVGGCTAAAPVVLVSFYAENDKNRTLLNWYTASETNNDYFNIERSSDGINFEVIGKVNGKGNTNGVSVYSFADENTPSGKIYYRLMQYDYDGISTSSYVISVDNETTLALQVAPNPFGNATEILVSSNTEAKVKVRVTDLSGHALYEGIHNVNEKASIGENMTAGVYILQVQINDVIKTVKIIKQ